MKIEKLLGLAPGFRDLAADSSQCRTFVVPSILTAPLVDVRALTSNESENEKSSNILKHVTKEIFIGKD